MSGLTLRGVFERHGMVVIPLLQRDYAHGRPTAAAVRSRFLTALHDTLLLPPDDPRLPLDLDFVYGSPSGPDGAFSPLDGQQRLTTLFLLHWYTALRDGQGAHLRSWACPDGRHSAFSYRVRPTSADFFDALLTRGCDLDIAALPPRSTALSDRLRDQAWFFQSWDRDPTVRACLVVLDALHERFASSDGLYERLVDVSRPPITFQFLSLDQFGLSDDLYIKMNARGKPLTSFETFKANLEGAIPTLLPGATCSLEGTTVPLRTYVAQRLDTAWCDLFWDLRTAECDQDAVGMNAVRAVALVSLVRHGHGPASISLADAVTGLRDARLSNFDALDLAGCVTAGFVQDLVDLFDLWSSQLSDADAFLEETGWYDERNTLQRLLRGETRSGGPTPYAEWVQFVGSCLHRMSDQPADAFGPWMRVVANLARNTIYNRAPEFLRSAESLVDLVVHGGPDFLEHVSSSDPIRGFNQQQAEEERVKAQLLRRVEGWRPLIEEAEKHGYFAGQIEFLFDFSGALQRFLDDEGSVAWDEEDDREFRARFQHFLVRSQAVFGKKGLREFAPALFERALLCEGDYLLSNRNNASFLDDTDRDLSWKRLLRSDTGRPWMDEKRALVGRLLDRIDPGDVPGSLQRRIAEGVAPAPEPVPGWRERFVEHPRLIAFCKRRQIRVVPGESIYLLRGVRRSGYHRELFTAAVFDEVRSAAHAGRLGDLRTCDYYEVMTDSMVPRLVLAADDEHRVICEVRYRAGAFQLTAPTSALPPGGDPPMQIAAEELLATLKSLGERWPDAPKP